MSEIGSVLPHVIITIGLAPIVVTVVYFWFGPGLAFRIFGTLMPLFAYLALSTMISLKVEVGSAIHIVNTIGTFVVLVGGLTYLYRVTVKPLREQSQDLQSNSSQLSATAAQSASTASEQSAMASQISVTVGEITQTSTSSAKSAQEIVTVAADALEKSKSGQVAAKAALDMTRRIGEVAQIINTIAELADQSNLLALNASIEAAKAGEQGRGFAVVAAEVRNLAVQSNEATQKIRSSIELTSQVQHSIGTVADVVQSLTAVLEDASDRSRRIASAAMQQATGIEQINDAAISLTQASKDSAESSRQIEQASANLEEIGKHLRKFVGVKGKASKSGV